MPIVTKAGEEWWRDPEISHPPTEPDDHVHAEDLPANAPEPARVETSLLGWTAQTGTTNALPVEICPTCGDDIDARDGIQHIHTTFPYDEYVIHVGDPEPHLARESCPMTEAQRRHPYLGRATVTDRMVTNAFQEGVAEGMAMAREDTAWRLQIFADGTQMIDKTTDNRDLIAEMVATYIGAGATSLTITIEALGGSPLKTPTGKSTEIPAEPKTQEQLDAEVIDAEIVEDET